MKVIRKYLDEFSQSEKKEIDSFIELNDGLIFHETKFNEIASEIFKTSCFYFIGYIGNEIVGICPAHIVNDGVLRLIFSNMSNHEIPYGGWIYNENKISIKSLLNKTKLYYNECLIYSSNIQKDKNDYEKIGFSDLIKLNTVILNLSQSIDELYLSSLKQKQRNKIKRAQKLGIVVEIIPNKDIELFINLSYELKEKVGLPVGLPEFYRKVMEVYFEENKIVCLAAKYCGEYISSMILVANKNYTIAWVAGRKVEIPNNLYQNELLLWESIVWAKKYGSNYFDLCGLDELKLPQLARIKLSFSKEIVPFYCINKRTFVFRVINRLQKSLTNL
jgi:lipid II:glycine glycyltransferase (peptidoglycan interpeptide bridge formation enzyme)